MYIRKPENEWTCKYDGNYRWNLGYWILKKLMSLISQMKKSRNLQAGGVKTWLMQEPPVTSCKKSSNAVYEA